ncbi:MAG TPA: toll/interleukin-1 receptor domain-containing protein [Candidatus Kapabacteria bacterium]|nr:toll/interleukin-1 receptor domain-containing protein [Candidatus Kapabacteria bacterium]
MDALREMKEVNWESFIGNLTTGDIIPVIGEDLSLVKNKNDELITLNRYIAEELTQRLSIPYMGQRICQLATDYPNANIMLATNAIYNNIDEDRFYMGPMEKLAAITDFKFYISTTLDDRLEKALRKSRNLKNNEMKIIDYSLQQSSDIQVDIENNIPVTVFNLLGSLRNIMESAFTEEEILEHFFSLSNKQNRHPLADYFIKRVKNKTLLFIGCDFPDWFMRFIIRILTNQRYKLRIFSDYIVSDENDKYPDLNKFLAQFNKNIITKEMAQGRNVMAFIDELYRRWSDSSQNHPVQYEGSVFLSYNHPDMEKAKTLKQLLKANGIRNAWFDIDDLHAGEHQALIDEEIKKCKVFIPLISNNSLTNNQSYMWKFECPGIEGRLNADKYYGKMSFQIIPIVLDNTARNDERIPKFMRDFTIWDLDKNKDKIIEEITKVLTPL